MNNDRVEEVLSRHFAREAVDEAAAARLTAKLATLPPQKHPTRWPEMLLDWQFAPAWPRLAALACSAALGFVVGTTSLDRLGGSFAPAAGNDLASIVFQPEAMTGLPP